MTGYHGIFLSFKVIWTCQCDSDCHTLYAKFVIGAKIVLNNNIEENAHNTACTYNVSIKMSLF